MSNTTFIDCVETARILRQVLALVFPQTKFSVRSKQYSGGASITVRWTDGATLKQVKEITSKFEGAGFDSIRDYKTSKVRLYKGEEVRFMADYIFEERGYSQALIKEALEEVARRSEGEVDPETIDLEALQARRYNPILQKGRWMSKPLWTAIWHVLEGIQLDENDNGISKEETQPIPVDMLPTFVREY
jgi:hypothetical protein